LRSADVAAARGDARSLTRRPLPISVPPVPAAVSC
jgi:hypothetical protein